MWSRTFERLRGYAIAAESVAAATQVTTTPAFQVVFEAWSGVIFPRISRG
jgi:hypothetical protein